MKILFRLLPLSLFAPLLAFAQEARFGNFEQLRSFLGGFEAFINGVIVPFIFTLAFVVFLWGVFKTFIVGASDEEKQEEGKQIMLWSIIGFVVMASIWGLVNLFVSGFGLTGTEGTILPRTNLIP